MHNSLLNKYSEIHCFTILFWKFEEVGNGELMGYG
jgi:hypothetical protein